MYRLFRCIVLIGSVGFYSHSINAALNNSVENSTNSIDDAVYHYHQGDFNTAIYQFQTIADEADSEQAAIANFMLGKMYERGDGVLIDDQIALSYYELASASGHLDAKQRTEEFNSSDESIVQSWYMEAAWDGDLDAQYNLGYLFESGLGVQIDKGRAIQWYEEAAKKQHSEAQFRLGLLLIGSESSYRDIPAGKIWLNAAAENGNNIAKLIVERLLGNVEESIFLQAVQGVRTYEHSETNKMREVIASLGGNVSQTRVTAKKTNPNIFDRKEVRLASIAVTKASQGESSAKQSQSIKTLAEQPLTSTLSTSSAPVKFMGDPNLFVNAKLDEETFPDNELSNFVVEKETVDFDYQNTAFAAAALLFVLFYWRKHRRYIKDTSPEALIEDEAEVALADIYSKLMGDPNASVDHAIDAISVSVPKETVKREESVTPVDKDKTVSAQSNNKTESKAIKQSPSEEETKSTRDKPADSIVEGSVGQGSVNQVNVKTEEPIQKTETQALPQESQAPQAASQQREKSTAERSKAVTTNPSKVPSDADLLAMLQAEQISRNAASPENAKKAKAVSMPIAKPSLTFEDFMPMQSSDVTLRRKADPNDFIEMQDISLDVYEVDEQSSIEVEMLDEPNAGDTTHFKESMSGLSDMLVKEDDIELSGHVDMAESYYNIGIMFVRGRGVTKNESLGIKWLRKSAEKGHELAKLELSIIDKPDSESSRYKVLLSSCG